LYMKKEFVGQKKTIKEFFDSVRKVSMGLGKKNSNASPDAYLFYGDKSCGKTLFSKTIKDGLEKNGASVIYYNGSQLADGYAQYKILSENGNNTTLCEKVVMNPNCVIIVDDFGIVNRGCVDLFSQILKEGQLHMTNGDIADFSNCKFIFTCGSTKSSSMGFKTEEEVPSPNLNGDFLSLIEKTMLLSSPSKLDLRRIVFNRLKEIKANLFFQNINLDFDFKFIKELVDKNSCDGDCVGVINSAIEESVVDVISSKILKGETSISL
jgi:ATP-dependent Clp protease ATP-binding subunit ClpA